MRVVLILLFSFGLTWSGCTSSLAMVTLETDDVLLHFPEGEAAIAARLNRNLADILSFLQKKGLPVKRPLHIVVDQGQDEPEVQVHVIPHLEIRIPLRAPGVLEEGYTEADPWTYFMFKGLCLQGIFGLRSGVPGLLFKGFGAIVSPNVVLPPWIDNGICNLLYAQYLDKTIQDPFEAALFRSTPPPDLEIISHHPQVWPGYFAYRIYGKPFLSWIYQEYGWLTILRFLQIHGGGLVPIEIDLKAREAFGKTFSALWRDFRRPYAQPGPAPPAILARGYWAEPFVFWNRTGVFPGKLQIRNRGRYGVVDADGTLWLSEFNHSAKLFGYSGGSVVSTSREHIWDPGPGGVAVSRIGGRPCLMVLPENGQGGFRPIDGKATDGPTLIKAPQGVLALSGPVRNERGAIAVAANIQGNWDIWVYDHGWMQLTQTPSIELDPWWEGDTLVYASNATGRFQIHAADQGPITAVDHMALLPRQGKFLQLATNGWRIDNYKIVRSAVEAPAYPPPSPGYRGSAPPIPDAHPYSPMKSLWPNYIRPDLFVDATDLQLGLATNSHDVSGDFRLNAGVRYSFDTDYFALRVGALAKTLGTQFTRYPVSYNTDVDQIVDESRHEARLFWRPWELERPETDHLLRSSNGPHRFDGLEFSLNWRGWEPLNIRMPEPSDTASGDEAWFGIGLAKQADILSLWSSLELFSENRQSLTLGGRLLYGEKTLTSVHLLLGRAWGGAPDLGHTAYRIGGNVSEGYFTHLPPKLFPVRGFSSNLIEASKAAAGSVEVFWPLANLQMGYATLPLFLHRLRLGTFIDAGIASEAYQSDDWLVGAGFEFVMSAEIAWGSFSSFRIGMAWPLVYPDYVQDNGVKFVIQLGRPL
ncbi:hypothetical protein [Desulfosarcina sp.]|uniref:TolB family protein n=1 Tax=Desulfosarcina sp. TaxID=2027861 RepID=UPI003568B4A1